MRANEEPIDDEGYDIDVRYLRKPGEGMDKYEVRWCNRVPGGEYRFLIEPGCKHSAPVSRAFIYKGFSDVQEAAAAILGSDGRLPEVAAR